MNSKNFEYLQSMGIQVWELQNSPSHEQETKPSISSIPFDQTKWDALKQQINQCALCDLEKTRTHAVFGVGNPQADLLIIGEAPGANEDLQGEPFVGRAGLLLNSMLKAINLERKDIFIANILKCRPPNNRDPMPREVECCTPYLQQQIAFIQPKLIVTVGRIAAHFLLDTKETLGKLRGKTYQYGEQQTPLIVTYHPAYLLRSPREKKKAYVDIMEIQKLLTKI